MGCDIHMCLEFQLSSGKWRNCNLYEKDIYESGYSMVSTTNHRNYDLFAALCGVRNRYEVDPVSNPKGLPNDMAEETKGYLVSYWDCDGHSHSWNTLRELMEYEHKPTKREWMDHEIVNPLEYLIEKIKTFSLDNYICFDDEEMKDRLRIVYCFDN